MAKVKNTKSAKFVDEDEKKETKPKRTMFEQERNPFERLLAEVQKILDARDKMVVFEQLDDVMVNVTPKPLTIPSDAEDIISKFEAKYDFKLGQEYDLISFRSVTSSISRGRVSRAVGFHLSIDDIIDGVGTEPIMLERPSAVPIGVQESILSLSDDISFQDKEKPKMNFVRIILRKTELNLLYQQMDNTTFKHTEEGDLVDIDNKNYDYLTVGRGRIRRRSEAEGQTALTLFKSRHSNTKGVQTKDAASYVSYFEMFDTYKKLDDIEMGDYQEPTRLHLSHSESLENQFAAIARLPTFHLASVVLKRLLAGNNFAESQRRFRNMIKIARTVNKIHYKYSLKDLFVINPAYQDNERKAVADLSFCYKNSDILAVAYGIYSYQAAKLPQNGEVCVWSIKNPCDPERFYYYSVPVVAVEFSPYMPSLLAIGLFDGLVEVRDIAYFNQPPVAVSRRASSPGVDPVLCIKWIQQTTYSDTEEIDPFLALSQDGSVTQYRIINSPYLAGVKLMSLERLEGVPEGLPGVNPTGGDIEHSNCSPQGLNLIKHPIHLDIYYILTDEGCIHKCSTNYQHHYMQVLKTHEGSVNHMDFSPWSPILFVTCGNDWCIRIWMDGIFEPLLTLKNLCKPYNWVIWSRTHSTILIAINGTQCELWDLRRNTLKPMNTIELNTSNNTTGLLSLSGTSLLIGKERGQVLVKALDDLPFPTYCQYDTLEKAIYKAVSNNLDLLGELKSIGYFGHPNKAFINYT